MSTDLAVIEAALAAATPGPWQEGARSSVIAPHREGRHDRLVALLPAFTPEDAINRALIANAPAWLAELVERVKAAEAEVERLREAVQDFADYGTRHDTTPTISAEPDVLWWYGYIQSMDRGVRERGRRALNHTGGISPGPVLIDEVHRFTSANSPGVDDTTLRARAEDATEPKSCSCRACNPDSRRMIVCATCGNKRCPHASNHAYQCTWSNEPDQEPILRPTDQRYEPPAVDDESGCCRG